MAMTQDDKNKWLIAAAVRRLLYKMPLQKIKVEDIMNESGMALQVFYRCFKDKNDVVQFCFRETNDQTMTMLGDGADWKTAVCGKLTEMAGRKAEFQEVFGVFDFRAHLRPEVDVSIALYKKIFEKIEHRKADNDMSFLIGVFSNGAVSMCAEWIASGMMESPEHLTDLLAESMPVKLKEMLKIR
ncbi:MAG: TetR/AcrR family transcriptional regulator C-terminal domain-containing protein [Oscillospiraceae bacterium]|nr:TetR/AcrR family transcriptional regulator C-terminal domain-containing protein [Oscillospiraceae bacterium]